MSALQERSGSGGGCLCGAVRYTIRGPIRPTAVACHCMNCRKFTGGLWVGTCARPKGSGREFTNHKSITGDTK